MTQATIGRIVRYQLPNGDADVINLRRDDYEAFQRGCSPSCLASSTRATASPQTEIQII